MPNRRLYTGTEVQTLAAGWLNQDGTASIYLTTDPSLNQATLALANHTSGPVVVAAGTPAAYGSAPEGAGVLYLYFNGLLTNAQVEAVTVGTAGWSAAAFTDAGTGLAYLAIAPAQAVTVGIGDTLTLALSGITASGSARVGNLTLAMEGVADLPIGAALQSIFVNVASAPAGPSSGAGSRKPDLLVGFAGQDFVFTGGVANELLLVVTNPAQTPLVPGGSDAWEGDPPTFTFSFVFAPSGTTSSPGALTDLGEAPGMTIAVKGAYGNAWESVEKDTEGSVPVWTVQPNPAGGGTVLGTGANASVSFLISGLVSHQPPGATYLYLSYANVPGYDDGYFAVEIVKVAPVAASLTASPTAIDRATSAAAVELYWAVDNATYATITNTEMAQAVGGSAQGNLSVEVAATTVYTLLASNHFTGQTVSTSAKVTVTPDVYDLLPPGTIVMWSGPADAPPSGWALCDGTNGTPNLVEQFILGAGKPGSQVDVRTSGGSAWHTHTATAEVTVSNAGSHTHGMPSNWYSNSASSGNRVTVVDRDASSVSDARTRSAGDHTHTASATVYVDTQYVMPPWYALAFIIRTA